MSAKIIYIINIKASETVIANTYKQALLGRIARVVCTGPVEFHRRPVVPSVSPLVTNVYCGKTVDSIAMTFGVMGRVGLRNQMGVHILQGNR